MKRLTHNTPLLYGVESGILNEKLLLTMNKCWNIVYRKIFGYFRWESVKILFVMLNKLNVFYLVQLRRIIFIKRWYESIDKSHPFHNLLITYMNRNEFQTVLRKFNINFHSSFSKIKMAMFDRFLDSCTL